MADNTTLNPGTGGDVIATDDIGGVKHQLVKVEFGAADSATQVSAANPLPVVQTGTHTVTGAGGTFPVTDSGGSLTVDNAGTFAVQASLSAAIPAGTNNIGDVDVLTVPADPFGANADAASATGSISAKLRFIASTGIPVTGTVTVASHAVTNAGTFVTQENGAALTALQLIDDPVATLGTTTYTEASTKGMIIGGVRRDANTTLVDTTNEIAPIQLSAAGAVKVAITEGGGTGGTAMTDAAAFTRTSTSITPIGGMVETSAPTVTNGNVTVASFTTGGAMRVAVASGGVSGIVDDAAFTPGTSEVLPIGFQADETSTDSVNEGDIGCPRITLDRKVIVTQQPHTQGGLNTAAGSITTTVTSVKASAGQLYGYYIYNPNASAAYCQIFDLATGSVTLGTTTPKLSFGIPATSAANVTFPNGLAFATAISIAFTTTRTGSSAPGSSVDYNFYHF